MCGILYYRSQKLVRGDERIARAMSHISVRGPDGQDVLWGEGCALGHTRLAIIDPSAAANQPFWDASRRYVIAYNGEIYNYAELRRELINRGINLRTTSDTEVLIELLARDGWAATCRRVRGMFAFILIDNETGKVLVARDHFGQKPLYWHYSGGAFAAASDPMSVVELAGRREPDLDSYSIYASTRSTAGTRGLFDPERSMFAGVQMLPAGHILELDGGKPRISRYFAPHELYSGAVATRQRERSEDELVDELRHLLRQSAHRHLVSDVPVGTLLSGGVDSSLIHWYASELTDQLSAFIKLSPGIEEIPQTVVPELLRRRPASAFYHVQRPENYVRELVSFIAATRAPGRWGGGPPMYKLCVDARRNGIVALLGGDCADEVFGGYETYEPLIAKADTSDLGDSYAIDPVSPFRDAGACDAYEARQWQLRHEIEAAVDGETGPQDRFAQVALLHDLTTFVQVCNLPHSDAYSMMASVELRNPMLDLDLVTFAVNLPPRLKAARHRSGQYGKVLLRELVERDLGPFMQVRKEGTRNFAMRAAEPAYWRFDRFQICELIGRPKGELTKRQIVRLFNLEIFHRLFFGGGKADGAFLNEIMTETGIDFCGLRQNQMSAAWTNPAQLG